MRYRALKSIGVRFRPGDDVCGLDEAGAARLLGLGAIEPVDGEVPAGADLVATAAKVPSRRRTSGVAEVEAP
ncbi:hypothetical protein D3C86_1955160 [compost metagenome]